MMTQMIEDSCLRKGGRFLTEKAIQVLCTHIDRSLKLFFFYNVQILKKMTHLCVNCRA